MILGALDVGTNTVLMLTAERAEGGSVRAVEELARITRLGRGVDRRGALDAACAARTLATIEEFVARARALGAARIVAAATSALRDARDGAEFIARVKARTGVELEVISGRTEAHLSYLAVARGLPQIGPAQKLLIVDIGGGSTELIGAAPGRELQLASLQIGSVRLTERIIRHDPPSAGEINEMMEAADRAIEALKWRLRPDRMVGIAGTVTTICAVVLRLERYDRAAVHGRELGRAEVAQALARFAALPLAERRKLPGMVEGRADVILAGTIILDRMMERFGMDRVLVSDRGVRWGLMFREMDRGRAAASKILT